MRHILVFSLAYRPYLGGAEIALEEIMRRLPQFRFTVITARALKNFRREEAPGNEEQGNVRVIRVGPSHRWYGQYGYPFFAARRAFAETKFQKPASPELGQGGPDAVWGMMESYGGMAALMFHQKFPQIPYLLTMQSGDSDRFWAWRTWFWKLWYRRIFTRAAAIQAISAYLAHRAEAMGARCAIEVVPNGVAIESFSSPLAPEERMAIRQQWGLGEEGTAVITASRLVGKNGIDTLIRGYAVWRGKFRQPVARLLIAGKGPEGAALRKLARHEGIDREVMFLGEIPYYDLPRYYQAADLFARPSRSEGLGNAFLEAMAAGIPVIGTRVGGIPDFLKEGVTGLMVAPDDPQALAAAIEKLVNDAGLRRRLIENGSKVVQGQYSWSHVAERMGALFERMLGEQHAQIH